MTFFDIINRYCQRNALEFNHCRTPTENNAWRPHLPFLLRQRRPITYGLKGGGTPLLFHWLRLGLLPHFARTPAKYRLNKLKRNNILHDSDSPQINFPRFHSVANSCFFYQLEVVESFSDPNILMSRFYSAIVNCSEFFIQFHHPQSSIFLTYTNWTPQSQKGVSFALKKCHHAEAQKQITSPTIPSRKPWIHI